MEIEPYRELTTFPALLRTAMLEHNPDKPVEIMDFQRTFETPLDKAKWLMNTKYDALDQNSRELSEAAREIENYLSQEQSRDQQKKRKRNDLE